MRKIKLSKGLFALVSDCDYDRVNEYKWCASHESRGTKHYAVRFERVAGRNVKIRLHRFVMGLTKDSPLVVDHLDGDGLDCRRENLEVVTQKENMRRCTTWKKKGERYGTQRRN